ncbi:MAG: hypothetical protein WAV32_09760, partial [Halobacteriota archaeon]
KNRKSFYVVSNNSESMNVEMLLLIALAGVTALSTLGVLLSKDNFYAAMYMTLTLVMVATIYAFFALEPVFVLIVFVFVGAIGIVTVAIAATYRHAPERQFAVLWTVPVIITAAILGYSMYSYVLTVPVHITGHSIKFSIENFITPEYLLLFLFLTSLLILLMLSVINIYRSDS